MSVLSSESEPELEPEPELELWCSADATRYFLGTIVHDRRPGGALARSTVVNLHNNCITTQLIYSVVHNNCITTAQQPTLVVMQFLCKDKNV